ncbi:hypothetical protein F442_18439 [Phytophthora nicotianae P10297]|uniref:Uncharacterized protein n=1 Tax=Phytophthora nicotianae P10297 TaxID=1317064 RepID=W2YD17_PHYNI|nr:hypothetical protein F442_18439 [Phytophthora nicotianae P10297]
MVLLRARRNKLASGLRPGDSEDGSGARYEAQVRENRRRGALYALSSSNGKRLPSVSLQPTDARVRRDLLRLTQLEDKRVESEKRSVYEDEQNDCKHREHLNYRPPMDQIHKLRDLHTTVAKDCRDRVKLSADKRIFAKINQKLGSKQDESTKPEWRLGYSNNVDTGSRVGVGGIFEPRDGTRERILDTRRATMLLPDSVVVAYPLNKSDNQDEAKENHLVDSPCYHRVVKKKPWCPASSSKSASSASPRRRYPVERFTPSGLEESGDLNSYDHDGLQRFPIRYVESFEPIEADADFVVDPRCADKQQTLLTKVAETYSRVRARLDRLKEPHLRYQLPVEDAAQYHRAYRLGLDDVPSTASTKPKKGKQKLNFRPKSAGASVGFQTISLTPKPGGFLTPELNGGGKVAGARRRPHSANIKFLKHSTVYCMEPPTPAYISSATDFRSVVDVECQKRQRERDAILQKLAKRGLLHSIPLAQVFARLRREGLLNIDRRIQRSVFERMTLDEYMSACGCLNSTTDQMPSVTSDSKQPTEAPGSSLIKETRRFQKNTQVTNSGSIPTFDMSPSLIATRKTLMVSRQQFHLALEPFNLSPTDVNLLFSALDLTVSDVVQVWDAMCIVEMLQHEHTAIRRARVQQLQAPPAKDLEFFRRLNK